MKKFAKRFLSALSALTMLCSCMAITNASTIFAAAGDSWSVKASNFYTGKRPSSDTLEQMAVSPLTAGDSSSKITINNKGNYFRSFGSLCPGETIINDTGKTWTYEMQFKGDRTITIVPAADGIITLYWYDNGRKNVTIGLNAAVDAPDLTVTSSSATCEAGEEFTITADIGICLLEISYEYAKLTDYTWTLDESDLTLPLEGDLYLSTDYTTQITNKLNYSGSDYVLGSYSAITKDDVSVKGTSITVKPQDSWFSLATQSISGSAFLNASDLDGTYYSGDIIETYFEMYCSKNETAVTEIALFPDYGDIDYTRRLSLEGPKRDIMFTTTGPALVQVVFSTNSNGDTRNCIISPTADSYDADVITAEEDSSDSTTPSVLTATLTEAGTYYIYSSSKINVYSVNVAVGSEFAAEPEDKLAGAYVNDTGAYVLSAVTEAEAESGDTLTIKNKSTVIDTSDTVYSYVCIDSFVFAPSDIAADAAYIYGTKFTGSTADAAENILNNVTGKIS